MAQFLQLINWRGKAKRGTYKETLMRYNRASFSPSIAHPLLWGSPFPTSASATRFALSSKTWARVKAAASASEQELSKSLCASTAPRIHLPGTGSSQIGTVSLAEWPSMKGMPRWLTVEIHVSRKSTQAVGGLVSQFSATAAQHSVPWGTQVMLQIRHVTLTRLLA